MTFVEALISTLPLIIFGTSFFIGSILDHYEEEKMIEKMREEK